MKLVCFPYSGASGIIYSQWRPYLPSDWALVCIDYPGHGMRSHEALLNNHEDLVNDLYNTYKDEFLGPLVLFGHSLGALIAYDIARRLLNDGKDIRLLLVSGRRAPHISSRFPDIHNLDDDTFLKALNDRYGGIPDELFINKNLKEIFIPPLRADIGISEQYYPATQLPLSCPLGAFLANRDRSVTLEETLPWMRYSNYPQNVISIQGNHINCITNPISIRAIIQVIANTADL